MNTDNLVGQLQSWYASMCNGDWEHTYGIFISNIDNPGWALKVELQDSYLYEKKFKEIKIQREDESDWVICNVKDGIFQGYGGVSNLGELIYIFLEWAKE